MKPLICFTALLVFFVFSCKEPNKVDPIKTRQQKKVKGTTELDGVHANTDSIYAVHAPSRMTRRIRNDREGNLLMASYEDVIQYDGDVFSKLPKVAGIESVDAFDALQDSKGTIWIASTRYGVFTYKDGGYTHFNTENGLAYNRTIDLYEDGAGRIWVSTMGGISCFDGGTIQNFTTEDGLPHNDVNRIIQDKNGLFWIGTRGSACVFDGTNFREILTDNGKPMKNVRHIIEDTLGRIWFGGSDGLWFYEAEQFTRVSKAMVTGIVEDKKGTIWTISGGMGDRGWKLTKYSNSSHLNGISVADKIDIDGQVLFGIGEDSTGNIWIGTGSGVLSYDGNTMHYYIKKG